MTWDYRIIKHKKGKSVYFAVHEVFYDENGSITNWTTEPINLTGENRTDIIKILEQIATDIRQRVLEESELLKR